MTCKTLFLLTVLASSSSSTAFVNTEIFRKRSEQSLSSLLIANAAAASSSMADEESNNNNRLQPSITKKVKKRPRFVQSQHSYSYNSRNKPKSSSPSTSISQNDASYESNKGKDRMWKSSRSIEDLEQSLTKRWGTDLRPWTAGDNDYDDDDDDEDYLDEPSKSQSESTPTTAVPYFRARPVLDPWEAESSLASTTADDASSSSGDKSSSKQQQQQQERPLLDVSHLIRDKPVGGRGTSAAATPSRNTLQQSPTSQKSSSSTGQGGFFFVRPSVMSNVADSAKSASHPSILDQRKIGTVTKNKDKEDQVAAVGDNDDKSHADKTERRRITTPAVALLDKDGTTPLYLTTLQAERNFEEAVSAAAAAAAASSSEGEESPSSGDEEGQQQYESSMASSPSSSSSSSSSTWSDLCVTSPILLNNLQRMGCPSPLPVQAKVAEFLLSPRDHNDGEMATTTGAVTGTRHGDDANADVLVGTYTGSGKTLAFLVPLAQRLLLQQETAKTLDQNDRKAAISSSCMQVLVVAPGRELASQIVSVARQLLKDTDLKVQLAIGGTTLTRSWEQIRLGKPQIVVGTPGRLAELLVGRPGGEERSRHGGRLLKITRRGQPQTVVLDEFDALLEYKPHREKTHAILQVLKQRDPSLQFILCSATAADMMGVDTGATSANSQRLLQEQKYLRPGYRQAMADPQDILVTTPAAATTRVSRTVIHGVVHVPHRRLASETLRRILHTEPLPQQVLVFVEDSHKVKIVVEQLQRVGIIAAPLSGDDDKMDRADVSRALREGYVGLVVATELAARGLDAPLLTHVINWDLPTDASHYAHRAGRCGRGGRPGVVINMTTRPQDRSVPQKLAEKLGLSMHTVDVKNGRLNIVDPASLILDSQ